ncbi:HAMP domain-containing sensor histidine kinase [Nocardioides sp.]|uniref:sensor histidine kinase n=1 Tax=Nocardioides sp. TaxID=35761 RepID=UPI002D8046BF|nr:HAMP domain-containing sensor histidine kinase [Nocardioides sp.]HET8961363.1 HAMP domain-containing sensor histidine kinase [Nocardioides sp.]
MGDDLEQRPVRGPLTWRPAPRAWQGAFAVALAIALLLLVAGGAFTTPRSWFGLAALMGAMTTLLALTVPWSRLPAGAVCVVPVLDIATLGTAGLEASGWALAPLMLLPVTWCAVELRRRGAVVATVATLLLYALPALVHPAPRSAELAWSLLASLGAAGLSFAFAGILDAGDLERKRLATALETIDHQQRFADAILDTVDVGLLLLDRDGAYQTMNRRHRDFMRLAFPDGHDGYAGQLGLVFDEDGSSPLAREQMPTYRASQGEEFDDCRMWVGDDPLTWRALSVSARTVRNEQGHFAGAALAYKDVTEFMRALRVKDEFLASVSHELRTPLTSIRGYVDILLERDDLPPEQRGQLEVVARNGERLNRLVADLLHTARVEEGPMHVVRTKQDLGDIVRASVEAAAPAAQAAGVELRLDAPSSMLTFVDGQRIAQAVDNLISNAVKYTPRGGRVEVRLAADGGRVEICVADSGIGIQPSDRDRLFTRFFRSQHAEEQSVPGLGLGLGIARSIVEGHGGRIDVETEVGNGSVFRIRLPVESEATGPVVQDSPV